MPNRKSQKMPAVVLRKLETAISDKVPEHINVILELADLLNVSKESVYRRLRGTTAFTFDELWLLFQTFGISIDSLFTTTSTNHSRLRFVSVYEVGILDYCHELGKVYAQLADGQATQIFNLSSQIPLIHLLTRKPIVQFKLDLWNHMYQAKSHTQVEEVLRCFTQNQPQLESITQHEMWSSSATQQIINELEYAIACGLVFSEQNLFSFFQALIQLVDEFVFSKIHQRYILYQQELDVQMNVMISFGATDSIIVHFGDDMVGVAIGQTRFENQMTWIKGVQSQCIRITGQSERQKRNFYMLLTNPIYKVATKLLTETQLERLRARH